MLALVAAGVACGGETASVSSAGPGGVGGGAAGNGGFSGDGGFVDGFGGTATISPCGPDASCNEAGALCIPPATFAQPDLCVCDDGALQCPAPDGFVSGCPTSEPTGACPATFGPDCPYPAYPAVAATVDVCTCSHSEEGQAEGSWDCFPVSAPALPPANGASCTQERILAQGAGFRLFCECVNGVNWCNLEQASASPPPVVSGASCTGYPRGYPLWQSPAPNTNEACTCTGSTQPTWSCAPYPCPATQPAMAASCPFPGPDDGFTFSCGYAGHLCSCNSGQWACD